MGRLFLRMICAGRQRVLAGVSAIAVKIGLQHFEQTRRLLLQLVATGEHLGLLVLAAVRGDREVMEYLLLIGGKHVEMWLRV